MHSKRAAEGYLLIDNRESPGVPDEAMPRTGPLLPPGAGRGLFEAPTVTCSHCQVVVIVNPLRNRERAYCQKCDHYICDPCNLIRVTTGLCRTFNQIIADVQERAIKGGG